MRLILFALLAVTSIHFTQAQPLTQVLRGTVNDKQVKNPLIGATVAITSMASPMGTITDESGNFKISGVPVGTHTLTITYMGYKPIVVPNVMINSGKETVLTIEMDENVIEGKEVVVTADKRKDLPLNEMSAVSTRTFSVEETQKYAAAVNDPSRMVTSYAGIVSPDDGNNRIIIRGNAPNGLLWRMEGVEIPNPNHFSEVGTSGGGISILSAQLLSNSDFSTGAFAAEYGNALSGVFDLRLRKGNNEKKEFTAEASFLGLNLAAEGPFSKKYKGSYLVNYRYSTLGILGRLGVFGDDQSITTFQDLSYHVYLPTKKAGNFSLFGFGGLSTDVSKAVEDSTKWEFPFDRYGDKYYANTGLAGFTHSYLFNSKAYIKTALSLSATSNGDEVEYTTDELTHKLVVDDNYTQYKQALSSVLNYKFNSRLSLRTGFIQSRWQYSLKTKEAKNGESPMETLLNQDGTTYTTQAFAQFQYHLRENLVVNAGAHYLLLWLNETQSVEPRASVKWDFSEKQSIALGYGLHSQTQPIGVYFGEGMDENGNKIHPNKNLGFTKAQHLVLSYNYLISKNLRLKTEVYYQQLFDAPVTADSATNFSMLNLGGGFVSEALANKGTGQNYGAEFTLEKFLANRYYFMLSASIYDSKYKGSDGIEHDTRYNGNYAGTLTAGKEFVLSRKSENTLLGFNIKSLYSGGLRYTPFNFDESIKQGVVISDPTKAYSAQNPYYFRTDIRVSLKFNRPKQTSTLSLDIQNVTNRKNVYGSYLDVERKTIVTSYQTPLIPVLGYRIEF